MQIVPRYAGKPNWVRNDFHKEINLEVSGNYIRYNLKSVSPIP